MCLFTYTQIIIKYFVWVINKCFQKYLQYNLEIKQCFGKWQISTAFILFKYKRKVYIWPRFLVDHCNILNWIILDSFKFFEKKILSKAGLRWKHYFVLMGIQIDNIVVRIPIKSTNYLKVVAKIEKKKTWKIADQLKPEPSNHGALGVPLNNFTPYST